MDVFKKMSRDEIIQELEEVKAWFTDFQNCDFTYYSPVLNDDYSLIKALIRIGKAGIKNMPIKWANCHSLKSIYQIDEVSIVEIWINFDQRNIELENDFKLREELVRDEDSDDY